MTTPPAGPDSSTDQGVWSAPAAPLAPPGYVFPPPAYDSPSYQAAPTYQAAPSNQAVPSVQAAPDRPTSMWLTLEGAAGTQFAIYNLDKNRPDLYIDGIPAKRDINGYFKVPMQNGKTEKLKARATVPGYPTLKFRGKTLYKSPSPTPMVRFGYVVPAVGAAFFGGGWFGGLGAVLCALGVGYGAASWIRTAQNKRVAFTVLMAGGVVLTALGVVGVIVNIRLRSQ